MRALLDVNVLIALLDAGHLMHRPAMAWLEREIQYGWASCPITENGVVRIMSQPGYPNTRPAAQIAERLAEACHSPAHAFWADDTSLIADGILDWRRVLGHRQVTDAYLLAMAVRHQGRFVTLDQRTPLDIVTDAVPKHLCVIPCDS